MAFKVAHSTGLYAPAGRGKLYIAPYNGTTPPTYPGTVPTLYPSAEDIAADPGDFTEVGNCPSLEAEPTIERSPHYSSREGLKMKDFNPAVQTEYMLTIECDEISAKNLALMTMGTLDSSTGIITGLNATDMEYALIFISNNPIGPKANRYFRRVTISPNGTEQLINDEYLVLSYMADGLSDSTNYPDSPYFDLKYLTTTTTTTTTTSSTTSTTA